jgi:hypothetical protein
LPQWFLDEPPLVPFGDFFLRHFWILDTERPLGMTQGRIPESKVAEYGYRKGWPDDLIDLFIHVVLGLDRAYLSWCQKERERKSAQSKSK